MKSQWHKYITFFTFFIGIDVVMLMDKKKGLLHLISWLTANIELYKKTLNWDALYHGRPELIHFLCTMSMEQRLKRYARNKKSPFRETINLHEVFTIY